MPTLLLLLLGGFVLLVLGAHFLVLGASRLALRAGVSPLLIGLTVVAWGTSTPELAVSIKAGLSGQADIALGNAVGSNIFNVLIILGACAALLPLAVGRQLVIRDVPLMFLVSALPLALGFDGRISRLDGLLLVGGLAAYTFFSVRAGRREAQAAGRQAELPGPGAPAARPASWILDATYAASGLVVLVLGARWLVQGSVDLARLAGLSELVIGLTVVAAGTSLPEVATSIIATLRGERDIAVGNVVGSNIFNILAVLGAGALAAPDGLAVPAAALNFDIPVMMAVSFACLPIFFTGSRISRWEGLLLLGYYAAYTAYLILKAAEHDALPAFSAVMLDFVIPLTALTILAALVVALRDARRREKSGAANSTES
jgi:cation:H+ antiporter